MNDLTDSLDEFDRRLVVLHTIFDQRSSQVDSLTTELDKLDGQRDLLARVDQTLLLISTQVLGQSTDQIDKLVTSGLRLVFEDQDLDFKTHVEKFRGKTSIRFELLHNGVTAPMMDAFGGGVLSVAGVLLRIVTIMALGLKRQVFLDETLSHLSEQYIQNASRLLRKLADELDFTIVLVTHADGYADHADKHYIARAGQTGTKFELQATS
jgi:hypothetical protein